ncbi:MAG: hypothetical protein IH840_14760, partial [Candidatus Heimdallarchaeota archaeon]|nr:hypothetical protein [Candidatus Heimdallarchaeota archaeon]
FSVIEHLQASVNDWLDENRNGIIAKNLVEFALVTLQEWFVELLINNHHSKYKKFVERQVEGIPNLVRKFVSNHDLTEQTHNGKEAGSSEQIERKLLETDDLTERSSKFRKLQEQIEFKAVQILKMDRKVSKIHKIRNIPNLIFRVKYGRRVKRVYVHFLEEDTKSMLLLDHRVYSKGDVHLFCLYSKEYEIQRWFRTSGKRLLKSIQKGPEDSSVEMTEINRFLELDQ